jgi:hypothetical protein
MKLFLFSFVFLLQSVPLVQALSDKEKPELVLKKSDLVLQIPEPASQALKKWNSEFKVFANSDYSSSILKLFENPNESEGPAGFIADLTGDGKKSYVLLGEVKNKQYAVALVENEKKWKVIEVDSWNYENVRQTKIPSFKEKSNEMSVPMYVLPAQGPIKEKLIKKTGIQVENYLGVIKVFEIKYGKAVELK